MFEGHKKPTELTERDRALVRKHEELAGVLERLQAPDLSPRLARELKKQQAILDAEIAELERLS